MALRLLDPARFVLLVVCLGDQRTVAVRGLEAVAWRATSATISEAVVLAVRIGVDVVIIDAQVQIGAAPLAGGKAINIPSRLTALSRPLPCGPLSCSGKLVTRHLFSRFRCLGGVKAGGVDAVSQKIGIHGRGRRGNVLHFFRYGQAG